MTKTLGGHSQGHTQGSPPPHSPRGDPLLDRIQRLHCLAKPWRWHGTHAYAIYFVHAVGTGNWFLPPWYPRIS